MNELSLKEFVNNQFCDIELCATSMGKVLDQYYDNEKR